jgi:hypothetical protein
MFDPSAILYLASPCCSTKVEFQNKTLNCSQCSTEFPSLGGIPWLYKTPTTVISDWRNRYNYAMAILNDEIQSIKQALKDDELAPLTIERLRKLLQAKAEHGKAIHKILAPLEVKEVDQVEYHIALRNKLPESQTLMSYHTNIFRDWAWESDENQASVECLRPYFASRPPGVMAVLGAGGCRLAFDLHHEFKATQTIMVDVNPLLFYLAHRVISGRNVTLYEFPLAPRSLDDFAIKQKLNAPAKPQSNLSMIFADAMNPTFPRASLDTIVTPWMIDIVPQEFGHWATKLGASLKQGGRWINFGSVAFNSRNPAHCYSHEEVLDKVEAAGFKVRHYQIAEIPYLQSPHSSQIRRERVLCFDAEKTADLPATDTFSFLPSWLTEDEAIPMLPEFRRLHLINQTFNRVIELIDGKRNVREIGKLTAPSFGLDDNQGQELVRRLLTSVYEGTLTKPI